MTDATTEPASEAKKASKLPLIIGVALGLAGAAGGYFASSSGMIFGGESGAQVPAAKVVGSAQTITFVPLEPLTISLQSREGGRHLRFRAELEVESAYASEIEQIKPRIINILNGYLRALELEDLQNPSSLTRLRAQMLRRVQVVAGPDKVNDLLIMEFVVN
jgi:flagellar FliL protein